MNDTTSWFEKRYKQFTKERTESWEAAFALAEKMQQNGRKLNIVETRTQREIDDWGAGCSSLMLSHFAHDFGHKVWSVDISSQNLSVSIKATEAYRDSITHACKDSVAFLRNFPEKIDFLYLDSYDWFPNEPMLSACQQHQLNEFYAVESKLASDVILLLDDNALPGGGKTKKTKEHLASKGWQVLVDAHQSLWVPA